MFSSFFVTLNKVQSGGRVEINGSRTIAIIEGRRDLNRQVVKSEHCTVKIKGTYYGLLQL